MIAGRAVFSGKTAGGGCELYFERRGAGPPLLLIVGGGGDCGYYEELAAILADEFTVLSYDRRGNSRSILHGPPAPLVMARQSADALAVLDANDVGSALVFGNSGGASITLDLAAYHPERVAAAVAHEPPVPAVLPDPEGYLATFDEVDRLLDVEDWTAAFAYFQATLGRVPTQIIDTLLDPGPHLPPGPGRDRMLRVSRNWEYMTRYEMRSFVDYRPDLDLIVANRTPIALAHGIDSDHEAVRMSQVAAARLGADCAVFPGGHTAPLEIPGAFAPVLRDLLHRLSDGRLRLPHELGDHGRQLTQRRVGEGALAERLDDYVVGAGGQVLPDRADHARGPGRDDRRDQPVAAAAGEISRPETEPLQVPRVVRQPHVTRRIVAGAGERGVVARERDGYLRHEQRLGAEHFPREPRVLGGGEVRVRTESLVAREPEHVGSEGREHDGRQLALPAVEGRMIELIEEPFHLRQRPLVDVPHRGDGGRVADAETKDEPAGKLAVETLRRRAQLARLPRPDVRDAGRHD